MTGIDIFQRIAVKKRFNNKGTDVYLSEDEFHETFDIIEELKKRLL